MKKSPLIAMFVLLLAVVMVFNGCEISIDRAKDPDTTKAGDETTLNPLDILMNGEKKPIETDPNGVPFVTVAVTDKKGEVIATEKVTLTPDEIKDVQDFFEKDETQAALPTGVSPDRVTEPEKPVAGKPSEIDIIYSDKYVIEGRTEFEGRIESFRVARDGKKYSGVMNYNGEETAVIIGDDNMYFVSVSEKTYITIPISLMEQELGSDETFQSIMSGDALNIERNKVSETTEEEYGAKYKVYVYEDGSKDYLRGKTLIKTVAPSGAITYYDEISNEVTPGLFLPPMGYTETVITAEDLAALTTTEHSHSHEE